MKGKHYTLLILLLHSIFCLGQYKTQIVKDNIKSLQVYASGDKLSYPVINLSQAIEISFDMLTTEMHQITYRIVHCDANWQPSDLSVNEYLEGFQENYVERYEYSSATTIDYLNYKVQLPNENVRLLLSGNYAVTFYDEDEQDTLLTACFSIVEPLVSIIGAVGGIAHGGRSGEMQQLNFTIEHPNYEVSQPITESKVVVLQNNSRHHSVTTSTPTYIHLGKLVYEQNPDFSFPGGDEYRFFEATSIRYAGKGVKEVSFFEPYYHFTLSSDDIRHYKPYEFDDDINGKFVIRRQQSGDEEMDFEADYFIAHFSLPTENPVLDGKVYIGGGFTYDATGSGTQMVYNTNSKRYEAHMLLKQGYYNYRYYVVSNFDGEVKAAPIERDAYQTENDYQIFFYHCPTGERYDRLVGYQVINSLNR